MKINILSIKQEENNFKVTLSNEEVKILDEYIQFNYNKHKNITIKDKEILIKYMDLTYKLSKELSEKYYKLMNGMEQCYS